MFKFFLILSAFLLSPNFALAGGKGYLMDGYWGAAMVAVVPLVVWTLVGVLAIIWLWQKIRGKK